MPKQGTTIHRSWFIDCADRYATAAEGSAFPIDWQALHPCDDREGGATIDAHYTPMDLWAGQRAARRCGFDRGDETPHVDVGSRLDGFCTHLLAAGTPVLHVDIRPPAFTWPGFTFRADDARTLATFHDRSVLSLSCLHTAEHIGLGRYGDDIDPEGMVKCMRSLARILAPGGRLWFACPVGRQRVCFNAHRVASPWWVLEVFRGNGLEPVGFAGVDDAGAWHPDAAIGDFAEASYACGCFEFRRPT